LWNSVRNCENYAEIENRILLWNWILTQEKFKLEYIKIKSDPNFNFHNNLDDINDANDANDFVSDPDNEFDNNKYIFQDIINDEQESNILKNEMTIEGLINKKFDYYMDDNSLILKIREEADCLKIYIPLINYEFMTKKIDIDSDYAYNPLFNLQLKKYLEDTWWKTVVFWSNLIPAIKDRSRRTTATVEVENNIIKTYDIKKRNLDIDEYLYQRVESIRNNQSLVAEKMRYLIFLCRYI
jgi:hypothetical protein